MCWPLAWDVRFQTRKLGRTYSPETVGLMSAAFDRVYQSVSSRLMNEHEDLKQSLALIILRHVDRGERDPEQLADVALR